MFILLGMVGLTGCRGGTEPEGGNATSVSQSPNIVIVIADDQDGRDSGAYGNDDVRTPNIDLLATQGMRFNSAFTGTPMCSATRQQLYTGLYPVRSGAYPNHSLVRVGTRSIATYLKDSGYRVGLNGKTHFGPPESYPFEFLDKKPFDRDWPSLDFEETEAFISRNDDQPFLLIVASMTPHFPWTMGDQSSYDPDDLTVPPHLVDTPETRQALAKYYAEIEVLDIELGRVMQMVEKADMADNTIFIYTSEHGPMFMQGKWTLYDSGIKTGLIVRWPGKVGEGTETNAMVHYVDVVPTLLDIVGIDMPDLDGQSFLDILTGEANYHRDHVFGIQTTRGVFNWRDDYPIRSVRTDRYKLILNLNSEGVFSNNVTVLNLGGYYESWAEKGDPVAMRKYRLYQERPPIELYDIQDDPFEQINLAGLSAYEKIQSELTMKLTNWMESQGDTGIVLEREAGEHMSHPVPPPSNQPLSF